MKNNNHKHVSAAFDRGPNYMHMSDHPDLLGGDDTPAVETTIHITIDKLDLYDKNPRTIKNAKYEAIKASIKERGLDTLLQVTQRPGSKHYMVCNGGNTRVAVLKELYEETQDTKYLWLTVKFVPWVSESFVLAGHLIENLMRGDLIYIDTADGINNLKIMLEEEEGRKLKPAELYKKLNEKGVSYSEGHVSRMQSCIKYIKPALSGLLYQGLTSTIIQKLLALHKGMQAVYKTHAQTDDMVVAEQRFEEVWLGVLCRFDTELSAFRLDLVRDQLLGRVAAETGEDFFHLEFELKKELNEPIVELPSPPIPLPEPSELPDAPTPTPVAHAQVKTAALRENASGATHPPGLPGKRQDEAIGASDAGFGTHCAVDEGRLASDDLHEAGRQSPDAITGGAIKATDYAPVHADLASTDTSDLSYVRSRLTDLSGKFARWAGIPDSVLTIHVDPGFDVTQLDLVKPRQCTLWVLLGNTVRALMGGALFDPALAGETPDHCERLPDALFDDYLEVLRLSRLLNR